MLKPQELIEKYKKLPQDIKGVYSSEKSEEIIASIAKEQLLSGSDKTELTDEIGLVLIGASHPKDFIKNIQTKIGIDEQKARAIAERVNDEIFQPVKESLKIVHNIKDEGASQASLTSKASAASIPTPPTAPTAPSSFPQMIVPPKINLEIPPKPPAPPQPPQSQNIFEQKLQGVFKMPREEIILPTDNRQQTTNQPIPPTPPRPSGIDPYREQPK